MCHTSVDDARLSMFQTRSYNRHLSVLRTQQRSQFIQSDQRQGRRTQPIFGKKEMPFMLAIHRLDCPRAEPELVIHEHNSVLEASDQTSDMFGKPVDPLPPRGLDGP